MKLSALAAQIKNCGHCEVINNGGRIFVGTGSAFYCKELRAANQNFPMFHSAHEGWAVIREEMSEAEVERYLLDRWIEERLWNEVKGDLQIPKEDLKEMQYRAVHMAVEAIQLAAMICKLERSQRRWPKKMEQLF